MVIGLFAAIQPAFLGTKPVVVLLVVDWRIYLSPKPFTFNFAEMLVLTTDGMMVIVKPVVKAVTPATVAV